MSSGRVHRAITIAATSAIACAGVASSQPKIALAASAGCAFGVLIHPDLDQESHAPWYWFVYAKLFKHRGSSHWPIFGTLTRLAYMAIPLMLAWIMLEIWLAISGMVLPQWTVPGWTLELAAWWVLGLMVSDTLHWIADWKVWTIFRGSSNTRKRKSYEPKSHTARE